MISPVIKDKKFNRLTGVDLVRRDKHGNGHYCKENCRWATWFEQSQNKRLPNGY